MEMKNTQKFVTACYVNNLEEITRMISEGVDINGGDSKYGNTGLMMAMRNGNNEVLKILLSCSDIKIDLKNKNGSTALHYACLHNQAKSVELFLAHHTCNKEIVRMKNEIGMTAEMLVDEKKGMECAVLVRKYLENDDDEEEFKLEKLTLTELAKRIEELHDKELTLKSKIKNDQKKELADHKMECKRRRDDILEKHDVDNKKFSSDNETTRTAIRQEIEKRLSNSDAGSSGPSTRSPSPSSLAKGYLDDNDDASNDGDRESKLENLTLTEVVNMIEEITASESLLKAKLRDGHKKELEKLNTEHRSRMSKLETDHRKEVEMLVTEYKKKRDTTLENQEAEKTRLSSENVKFKEALHQELERRLPSSATTAAGASTQPPPTSPTSLLPSCPVCYELMNPPLQIFTCGNGHLICSSCKPEVSKCICRAKYMGRATAMEQMVRMILNVN